MLKLKVQSRNEVTNSQPLKEKNYTITFPFVVTLLFVFAIFFVTIFKITSTVDDKKTEVKLKTPTGFNTFHLSDYRLKRKVDIKVEDESFNEVINKIAKVAEYQVKIIKSDKLDDMKVNVIDIDVVGNIISKLSFVYADKVNLYIENQTIVIEYK